MTSKPTSSDIYDINRKTGALILGKNRLEDYATKYLTKHCKEALETPMPLPVEKILADEKLTVREVSLSKDLDIFGCCMLIAGQINIYDEETESYHLESFPAGTILFDPKSESMYGEGAKRNTLIHEALHWEKDKMYFEILKLKNQAASEKLYPIMCRQSKTFYEPPEGKKTKENEVKWLEWQAHRLAPRILMPYEMFRKKALELIDDCKNAQSNMMASCDALVEALSEFFIVSRSSVKFRLEEVGLLKDISDFADFDTLYAEIKGTSDFATLTPVEAYSMLTEDSVLHEWVSGGRYVFVDGYFVLNNKEYITRKDAEIHLSAKGKRNLEKCALNIRVQKYTEYKHFKQDYLGYCMMLQTAGIDKRLYTFHPKFQTKIEYKPEEVYAAAQQMISSYDEDEEIELFKIIGDPTSTLCQCLSFLMERRKWKYPAAFNEHTELNKNYFGKIKNDNYNNMGTDVLMAICVGLGLTLRETEKLFDKSQNKLDYYHDPDKTYIRIMELMPGLPIGDFNSILEKAGVKQLGSVIKGDE